MSASVDVGTGATITFATSAFTGEAIDVMSFTGGGRESFDTSHFGTSAVGATELNNKTYILSRLVEGGEFTFMLHLDPDTVIPTGAVAEVVTIQYFPSGGDSTGATWVFSGGITGFGADVPMDGKMVTPITVKVLGPIVVTAGSV